MKGCYCLIINLDKTCNIEIGKLGEVNFNKGCYAYVGSAMNSLQARIERHINDEKKLHWHIDYFLKNKNSKITDVIYNVSDEKIECNLSGELSTKSKGITGFGCSDCKCESHLYYFKNRKDAIEWVENAYDSIAMDYELSELTASNCRS